MPILKLFRKPEYVLKDEHKDLENLASQSGLFYKPSGAGGGDLGFILSDSEIKVKKLQISLGKGISRN